MMQTANRPAEDASFPSAFEARISAWVDGQDDIRPEDVATPYGRQLWDTYHLIGDVMRNDSLAVRPSPLFYARLSKAIDAEPPIVAPVRWWSRRTALSGLAVAAAIAMVAWVVWPTLIPTTGNMGDGAVLASAQDDGPLRDYLEAHGEITGSRAIQRAAFGDARP